MTDSLLVPDNWAELSPMIDQLLDADQGERAGMLRTLGGDDPRTLASLAGILADCERETTLLERPASEVFDQLLQDDPPPVLGGRYALGRELGQGATSRVYEAHDRVGDRAVAVKVIRPGLTATLARDRFLREIAIASRFRHPNVVALLDSGSDGELLFLVMPVAAVSLRSVVQQRGALPADEALAILRDVGAAIGYAHRKGVMHRDIKPDNIVLDDGVAMVADFGIAKAMLAAQSDFQATTITQPGMVVGTPAYMAPEQFLADPDTDHRADLFAFGCTAYELLVGEAPFGAGAKPDVILARMRESHTAIGHRVREVAPAAVADIVMRCLEYDPRDRPANIEQVIAALDHTPQTPAPGNHRMRALLLVLLLLAAAATAWFLHTSP